VGLFNTPIFDTAPRWNSTPAFSGLSFHPVLTHGKPTYVGIPPEGDVRWELGTRGIGGYVLKGRGGTLYDVPFHVGILGKDAIRAWAARSYCAGGMKDHYGFSSSFSNVLSGCLNPSAVRYRRFKSNLFGGEVQAVPYYLGKNQQALWLVTARTGNGQTATVSVYLSRQFASHDLGENSPAKRLLGLALEKQSSARAALQLAHASEFKRDRSNTSVGFKTKDGEFQVELGRMNGLRAIKTITAKYFVPAQYTSREEIKKWLTNAYEHHQIDRHGLWRLPATYARDVVMTDDGEVQRAEYNQRFKPQPDGSLNSAPLKAQLKQVDRGNFLTQALSGTTRAMKDVGEGLINGKPGAKGKDHISVPAASDKQILFAQTSTPAQRFGTELRSVLTNFPFGRAVLDAAARVDLYGNPDKQEIYGRTSNQAAQSAFSSLIGDLAFGGIAKAVRPGELVPLFRARTANPGAVAAGELPSAASAKKLVAKPGSAAGSAVDEASTTVGKAAIKSDPLKKIEQGVKASTLAMNAAGLEYLRVKLKLGEVGVTTADQLPGISKPVRTLFNQFSNDNSLGPQGQVVIYTRKPGSQDADGYLILAMGSSALGSKFIKLDLLRDDVVHHRLDFKLWKYLDFSKTNLLGQYSSEKKEGSIGPRVVAGSLANFWAGLHFGTPEVNFRTLAVVGIDAKAGFRFTRSNPSANDFEATRRYQSRFEISSLLGNRAKVDGEEDAPVYLQMQVGLPGGISAYYSDSTSHKLEGSVYMNGKRITGAELRRETRASSDRLTGTLTGNRFSNVELLKLFTEGRLDFSAMARMGQAGPEWIVLIKAFRQAERRALPDFR
jgi:hypothetical protein